MFPYISFSFLIFQRAYTRSLRSLSPSSRTRSWHSQILHHRCCCCCFLYDYFNVKSSLSPSAHSQVMIYIIESVTVFVQWQNTQKTLRCDTKQQIISLLVSKIIGRRKRDAHKSQQTPSRHNYYCIYMCSTVKRWMFIVIWFLCTVYTFVLVKSYVSRAFVYYICKNYTDRRRPIWLANRVSRKQKPFEETLYYTQQETMAFDRDDYMLLS